MDVSLKHMYTACIPYIILWIFLWWGLHYWHIRRNSLYTGNYQYPKHTSFKKKTVAAFVGKNSILFKATESLRMHTLSLVHWSGWHLVWKFWQYELQRKKGGGSLLLFDLAEALCVCDMGARCVFLHVRWRNRLIPWQLVQAVPWLPNFGWWMKAWWFMLKIRAEIVSDFYSSNRRSFFGHNCFIHVNTFLNMELFG